MSGEEKGDKKSCERKKPKLKKKTNFWLNAVKFEKVRHKLKTAHTNER